MRRPKGMREAAKQTARRNRAAVRGRPVVEELEPRILYSADFSPALLDPAAVAPAAEHRIVDASGEFLSHVAQAQQARSHEVVFVDTATPDYQSLVDDIRSHSGGERQVEVILLDHGADGIREITDVLSTRKDVSAVHIIGHGADGQVELGKDTLNFESLLQNATQIKSWGNALAPGADLLIYGCDVAQYADGRSLVDALARLTGADVAASEDLTGAANESGDWTLEYQDGRIDTPVVISGSKQAVWGGILDAASSGSGEAGQAALAHVKIASQNASPTTTSTADTNAAPAETTSASDEQSAATGQASIASTPLAFEQNVGQADAQVDFLARGSGYAVGLIGGDAVLAMQDGSSSQVLRLDVVGKNTSTTPAAQDLLQSKSNYLVGRQDQWRTDIANFGTVRYDSVYDGIDLRYYGNQRQLEYDFLVDPGADVSTIKLKFEGVQNVSIADNGDLVLTLDNAGHTISFKAPVAYQDGPNGREAVSSHYTIAADGTVGFDVGSYDSSRQLVIDPVLSYGTYFGGNGSDLPNGIAVDAAGNVYITGYTSSTGLLGGLLGVGGGGQAYVAKFSPNLGSLIYSTYVGGSNTDQGNAIAVDSSGDVYVTGLTASIDFPTTAGAFQSALAGGIGGQDAFVFKLNPTGNTLLYSTYLGGTGSSDTGWAIAIDGAGSAYVTGVASGATVSSSNFPVSTGSADTTYGGNTDAFVAKLTPDGSNLVYSTFIGGSSGETGFGIAVDNFGNAVVVGDTASSTGIVPTGTNTFQGAYGGSTDVFVTKLNSTGTAFLYSTYLGGSGLDIAYNVTLDSAGKIYLTGETSASSTNLATTPGALKTSISGTDAFVSVIDPSTSGSGSLIYSTYLGGNKNTEAGLGVGVDAGGRVYVAGETNSTSGFPVTTGAYKTTNPSKEDAFLVVINPLGTGANDLVYGTYFGGSNDDYGTAGVFSNGKFYLTGYTYSGSGIATAGSYDTAYTGLPNDDAFVAVISIPPSVTTTTTPLTYIENSGARVLDAALTVSDPGVGTLAGATVQIASNYINGEDVLAFNNANSWGITGTWNPVTAVLTLTGNSSVANYQSALCSVTYQNTSENPSTASRAVTVTASDGVLVSAPSTRLIAVTPVDDPPINTAPSAQSVNEDTPLVFSSASGNPIAISDVDAGTGAMQVSLSVTNGVLTLASTSGLTFITGSGTGNSAMTFTGAVSNINAALNGLRFDPSANFNGPASLQIVTNDQGNTGTSGPQTATSTVVINVAAVNDPPVNSVPGPQSTQQNTALVFSNANGNAITLSDVDAGTGNLQVTLTALDGALTLGSVSGLTVSGQGTGSVVFSGTLANLNAALDGLTFMPVSAFTGGTSLVIATGDLGNTGLGGPQNATTTLGITVSPNLAPTVTTTASTLSYTEKDPATPVDPNLTVTDLDSPVLDHAVVRIAANYVNGQDVLGFTNQLGITGNWDAATGTLTLVGAASQANYQTALRSVTYQNLSNNPSTAMRTVTFVANDSIADGAVASRSIAVTAINDPPTNAVPTTQTTNEDTALVFSVANGNELKVGDPDAGSNSIRVVLNATNGTLTLAQVSGLAFGAGSNGSSTMTVTGTVDDINAALNGLSFAPVANYSGPANVQIVTDDLGNSGSGLTVPAIGAVAVAVVPVNDPPQGIDNSVTTAEDTAYIFTLGDFAFSDPDDSPANNLLAVRIATLPAAGLLTDNGVGVTAGQFVSAGDIAAGKLLFSPAANASGTSYASFTFHVQDDGGTTNGGVDTDPTPRTMTVNVTSVNDAPQGASNTVTVPEDSAYTFGLVDFGFSDPNDSPANALQAVEITTLPTAGTLTDNSVVVTAGQFVSVADISANKLVFIPATNGTGNNYAAFTFRVQDDGGTTNGGVDTDSTPRTMTIDVTATNDAPANGVPGAQNTAINAPITFSGANAITVSDVDANGGVEQITLSVSNGTLSLGSTVGLTSVVGNGSGNVAFSGTLADLNNALDGLTYTPNLNYSGTDTLSVDSDDLGNTGSPGPQTSTSTVGITVQPNQAPTLTATASNPTFQEAAGLGVQSAPINVFSGASVATVESGQSIIGLTFTVDGLIDGAQESIVVDGTTINLGAASSGITATPGMSYSVILSGSTAAMVVLSSSAGVSTSNVATLIDGIAYQNTNTDDPSVGSRVFTITQIQDSGGVINGGTDTSAPAIVSTVNVVPVNDAPVNTVPGLQTTSLNTPLTFSSGNGNVIAVSDVDANGGIEQITLSVANGRLNLGGTAGVSVSGNGTSNLLIAGTLTNLNAALDGLTYTPNVNFFGTDGLTVVTDDLGNSGIAAPQTSTDTVSITVAYNAPTVTSSGVPAVYTEKAAPIPVDAGLTLSAGTLADLTGATVQISAGYANGEDVLTFVSQPGISGTWNPATGTLILSGTSNVANYQAALQSVSYRDTSNNPSTATRTVTFAVDDGVTLQSASQQVNVTAVNDAPTLTAPVTYAATERVTLNLANTGITVGDVDANSGVETLTLSVASGVVNAGAGATGVTVTNSGTASVTLSGTVTQLNDLLAGNNGASLDYFNALRNPPASDTLTLTIDDSGNTGGGPLAVTRNSTIAIAAVNDAPVNIVPGAQTTAANTPVVFSATNGNRVFVLDLDANAGVEQITVSVVHGRLTLSGTTGLTLVAGANGSASMTYRGTLANLDAALNGLSYVPASNYSGADTLSVTSNDLGNTGSGGPLSAASAVSITVNTPPPPPVVVAPPPPPPPAPAPSPSPGPSSPPTPAPPATPAPPPSPPTAPGPSGGTPPTGGSGGGEPVQAVSTLDQTGGNGQTSAQAAVLGRMRGSDLVRIQALGPVSVVPTTSTLGGLSLGAGLTHEATLPAMQTETLTISSMDPEFSRAADPVKLAAYRSALGNKAWVGELDRMRETIAVEPTVEHKIVGSTVAVTGAMSVGYVIWLLRGGLLLSSLLSSLPAWHSMDPMPVLARSGNSEEDGEEDDPLETLFGRAKAAIGLGRARTDTDAGEHQSEPATDKTRRSDETAALPA